MAWVKVDSDDAFEDDIRLSAVIVGVVAETAAEDQGGVVDGVDVAAIGVVAG